MFLETMLALPQMNTTSLLEMRSPHITTCGGVSRIIRAIREASSEESEELGDFLAPFLKQQLGYSNEQASSLSYDIILAVRETG